MNAPEKLTVRIKLPSASGKLEEFRLSAPRDFGTPGRKTFNRIALAAAHVVADPLALGNPWLDAAVDWDATTAYRHYLWSLGLGVAEAMDTAQRGMGLGWNNSLELIRRSVEASKSIEGAVLFSGAGTDQLAPSGSATLDEVVAAYEEQCEAIEDLGGRIVLMASRALAACARSPDDYHRVYSRILSQLKQPVIIHWLGEMFDPQLAGYWGERDHGRGLQLRRADRGRQARPFGRTARDLRCDRPRRVCGAGPPCEGRCEKFPRHPRPDRATRAPHFCRADALLQDGPGVPRMAERPPRAFRHDRRPAIGALAGGSLRNLPAR